MGVAFLADQAVQLLKNSPNKVVGGEKSLGDDAHLAFVIASILHDCGHGPLGHTMDLVRRHMSRQGGHEQDSMAIFNLAAGGRSFADLHVALDDIGVARALVRSILRGEHPLAPLLSNPAIDIDRLDFLMRDGYNTICSLQGNDATQKHSATVRKLAQSYESLLEAMAIRRDAGNGKLLLGFSGDVREWVREVAELYCFMYTEVYQCWQNCAAQSMIAIGIEEVLRSGRYNWYDVLRLTDVELFAALEEFENPLVCELAYLVKYRRLLEFAGEFRFEGELRAGEEEVLRRCSMPSPHDVIQSRDSTSPLVVPLYLKQKGFRARFVKADVLFDREDCNLGDEEVLATTPGRLMLFCWPGTSLFSSDEVEQLKSVLEEEGCSHVKYVRHQ